MGEFQLHGSDYMHTWTFSRVLGHQVVCLKHQVYCGAGRATGDNVATGIFARIGGRWRICGLDARVNDRMVPLGLGQCRT